MSDENQQQQQKRRGRPVQIPQADRVQMVLDATIALLSEMPLQAVTMSQVARAAGMSKRTIYEMFDSRDALLSATIAKIIQQIYPPLPPEAREMPLEQRLRLLLGGTPEQRFRPESCELLRAIISGAQRFPALARRTNEEGFIKLASLVREELLRAQKAGEIALPPDRIGDAAELLVTMTRENVLLYLLDNTLPVPTPEEQAARRDLAIGLFLDGARSR